VFFSVLLGCAVINALANVIRVLVIWGGWFFSHVMGNKRATA
jgi:hypothetical protein